jgi:hypothetical protein
LLLLVVWAAGGQTQSPAVVEPDSQPPTTAAEVQDRVRVLGSEFDRTITYAGPDLKQRPPGLQAGLRWTYRPESFRNHAGSPILGHRVYTRV